MVSQAPGLKRSPHSFPHSYLFVNLCKLFQVVLKKGNLLLLGVNPPTVLGLHFCTLIKDRGKYVAVLKPNRSHPNQAKPATGDQRAGGTWEQEERMGVGKSPSGERTHFLDSSRDVLNEQLAKVVEGLEFPGLERMMKDWGSQIPGQPFYSEVIGAFSSLST